MNKNNCPICSSLSDLSNHAHELYFVTSFFIGVKSNKIRAIGEWLRLSSMLQKVEISPWKHDRPRMFICEPAGAALDSEEKYYSLYATELTRFFYTMNALEETYRLVAENYKDNLNKKNKKRIRDNSIKSLILFEHMESQYIPKYMPHINDNLRISFEKYCHRYEKELINTLEYSSHHKCYGLNLVRNLRNHLAHGVIPININPDYNSTFEEWFELYHLLRKATRVTLLYIQAFLSKYGTIFDTEIYLDSIKYFDWCEEENNQTDNNHSDASHNLPDLDNILAELHLKGSLGFYKFINF